MRNDSDEQSYASNDSRTPVGQAASFHAMTTEVIAAGIAPSHNGVMPAR